ncbi:MAG: FAD-binding oxidoreductase, partial [Longimicrobiales bacterium]
MGITVSLHSELREALGEKYVLVEPEDVIVYERDGSIIQVMPEVVALPADTAQVAAVVRAARRANVPIVPRGSGTGLAGGAVPAEGGVVVSLARMNRILEVDPRNRTALLEAGVINLDVTKAAASHGLFYAPDPS